jgi:hypothetical protein
MSRLRLAVVIGAVVGLAVGAAAFLLLRDGGGADAALSTISTPGRAIEMAVPENLGPVVGDLTGEVEVLAQREGLRFVRMARAEGGWCYGTADRRFGGWTLTDYSCRTDANPFPSPDFPVIHVGRHQVATANPQLVEYLAFAGFAADGVRSVGIVDSSDRVTRVADVVDNAYYAATPPAPAKHLVAFDEDGDVIWRSPAVPQPDE